MSGSQVASQTAGDQRQGLAESLPSMEDVKAVPPEEVDMQARVERLRAGSKSVHFPLRADADDSASEASEADLDTPKHPPSKAEGECQYIDH